MFIGRERKGTDQINGFIGKGVVFSGKLEFSGTMRIDGTFKGEINANGTLIAGEGAKIEAKIKVDTAIISGEVVGDIEALKKVELRNHGKMYGNIKAPKVVVDEGFLFDGKCSMAVEGEGREELKVLGRIEVAAKEG